MIAKPEQESEREEIEALLPWHAAGSLSADEAERVEAALATDPVLQRHYALVREELHETIHLNETLGAPSARARERLFAAIDAEPPRQLALPGAASGRGGRLIRIFSGLSPRILAYGGSVAALALLVQAAVLTSVLMRDQGITQTQLASAATCHGVCAMVRFVPQATSGQITKFLKEHRASLISGPGAIGEYRIKLSDSSRAPDAAQAIRQMQNETQVVEFIAQID